MKIQDLLQRNAILIDLPSQVKAELLCRMSQYLVSLYGLKASDMVVDGVIAREADLSTGIGHGVAIPHARLDSVDRIYMIAARSAEPVEFGAIDDEPVRLLFMSVSPSNSAEHGALLSQISKVMYHEQVRSDLLAAPTAEEFLRILVTGENTYA